MSHPELVESMLRRLQMHRENVVVLLQQRAVHTSASVPVAIVSGIREERRQIGVLKAQLRQLGMSVTDLPDDEEGAPVVPATGPDARSSEPRAAPVLTTDERAALAKTLLDLLFMVNAPLDLLLGILPVQMRAAVRGTGVMQADVIALLDQFAPRRMLLSDGSHPLEHVLGRAVALAGGLQLEQDLKHFLALVGQRLGRA